MPFPLPPLPPYIFAEINMMEFFGRKSLRLFNLGLSEKVHKQKTFYQALKMMGENCQGDNIAEAQVVGNKNNCGR